MIALLAALAWDLWLGEPPNWLHPVCWLGNGIAWIRGFAPRFASGQLIFGAVMTTFFVGLAAGLGWLAQKVAPPLGWLLGAFLLKSALAGRELVRAGARVAQALEEHDVERARAKVSEIVSRDVSGLDAAGIAAAAVQSVAENLCDSLVAPLFYYAIFGLTGALAYRTANTLDAMIGYRGKYEYLGKFAAKLDDVLNFLPARLAALILLGVASLRGRSGWQAWWRDHRATPSPNGGHPMAAAAGILGVELEKRGYYRLGSGPQPEAATIRQMNRYAGAVGAVAFAMALAGTLTWPHAVTLCGTLLPAAHP